MAVAVMAFAGPRPHARCAAKPAKAMPPPAIWPHGYLNTRLPAVRSAHHHGRTGPHLTPGRVMRPQRPEP